MQIAPGDQLVEASSPKSFRSQVNKQLLPNFESLDMKRFLKIQMINSKKREQIVWQLNQINFQFEGKQTKRQI